MQKYIIAAVLLLTGTLAASESMLSSGEFSYSVPRYSVTVSLFSRDDAAYLEEQGFLIEWAHGNRASIYVDAEMESMLRRMGYDPVPVVTPAPLVPYPSISEIYDSINDIVAAHPDICRKVTIGTSVEGRPIEAVVVSDNVSSEEIEPEMRLTGAIHGDEKTAAMTVLTFLEVLTDNYVTSPMCQYLVDTTEIWVIPVVNPDGYVANQRTNANGIDLNRNCSYMGPGGGGGSTAFSEPETSALRDLTMQNWPDVENFINPFTAGLSLHGGENCINTVWNYTGNPLPEDSGLVHQQAIAYAGSPGLVSYFSGSFWIAYPGFSWYQTNGDVNDWSYGECGTVDHTVEVHDDKQASDWPGVANAHYMAMLDLFIGSTYGIWGTVTDIYGDPIDAGLAIGIHNGTDSQPLRFCRTDVTMGDYNKALLPGIYDVTVSADGYVSQTVESVDVGPEERVEVSFVLYSVGIEGSGQQSFDGDFSVFPNPAAVSCSFSLPVTGVGGTVSIYDITGRSLFVEDVSQGNDGLIWDLRDAGGLRVPSGIYIARFRSGGSDWSTRLIVNR
jgi:hypothetical protein